MGAVFHYTNKGGWNGIRSARVWRFLASDPPAEHPRGAYFTSLDERTPYLARKLGIPRTKLSHVFVFVDGGDLKQLDGDRGRFVFYFEGDYLVAEPRQMRCGETSL